MLKKILFCLQFIWIIPAISSTPANDQLYANYGPASEDRILKEDKAYWYNVGDKYLNKIMQFDAEPKKNVAKNIIIFIGDGMSIGTLTSSRIFKGQRRRNFIGEEFNLAVENFPNVGLAKTYNVDMQVPDSAGTGTAIFTGVKTRFESIGLDVNCNQTDFDKETYEECKIESIMTWAQRVGKYTGIVTTTRISHATPAATYAHANYRYWECDEKIPQNIRDQVKDISRQLIEDSPGRNFKVILGGGYQMLGHTGDVGGDCKRTDGLNLTATWMKNHAHNKYVFATNNEELGQVDNSTEYLLGLFAPDHMPYEVVRNKGPKGTPSLTQMVVKALQILRKGRKGFVLMVEGGMIDQAHHKNFARAAMREAAELDTAINIAVNQTNPDDTLIIVTSDHSHTMTFDGYSKRGNDILGYSRETKDAKSFLTLAYANGPGFKYHYRPSNSTNSSFPWIDIRKDKNRLRDPLYQHQATFYQPDTSHSGEDVAVFAKGPGSHLIRGVFEQNYIAHVVSYAGCLGPHRKTNPYCSKGASTALILRPQLNFWILLYFLKFFV